MRFWDYNLIKFWYCLESVEGQKTFKRNISDFCAPCAASFIRKTYKHLLKIIASVTLTKRRGAVRNVDHPGGSAPPDPPDSLGGFAPQTPRILGGFAPQTP